jgi:hypothetical protein
MLHVARHHVGARPPSFAASQNQEISCPACAAQLATGHTSRQAQRHTSHVQRFAAACVQFMTMVAPLDLPGVW